MQDQALYVYISYMPSWSHDHWGLRGHPDAWVPSREVGVSGYSRGGLGAWTPGSYCGVPPLTPECLGHHQPFSSALRSYARH